MHDPEMMPARLARFLSERDGVRSADVVGYEVMVGGYSRLMARADVLWSDGQREALVLRGDPPTGKAMIETDRDTEEALLRALCASHAVATPALRDYDATGEHLDTKCLVIEFVEGQSLQAVLQAADPSEYGRHSADLIDTMARIHVTGLETVGDVLARPSDPLEYLGRLIDRFRQADAAHVESVPFLRYVASWLDANRPPPLPLGMVHGDFQPANIMVTPDGAHMVIDWELAHVGDPREDLGYYNIYSAALGPNLFQIDPDGFLARYRERTGFCEDTINMQTMSYFSALAAVNLYAQMLAGAAAFARCQNSGLITTYTLSALTVGHSNFLAACSAPKDLERI
jgi:aminoglycoside phosphotransferase (APT) family kinase protein